MSKGLSKPIASACEDLLAQAIVPAAPSIKVQSVAILQALIEQFAGAVHRSYSLRALILSILRFALRPAHFFRLGLRLGCLRRLALLSGRRRNWRQGQSNCQTRYPDHDGAPCTEWQVDTASCCCATNDLVPERSPNFPWRQRRPIDSQSRRPPVQ